MDLHKKVKNEKITRETFKFLVCMMILLFAVTVSAFAQDGTIEALEGQAGKLMDLFSGPIIAIVMCIALIICFGVIAWGNAQGEGGTIKKVMPWIIGIIGIGSAAGITTYFLGVEVG